MAQLHASGRQVPPAVRMTNHRSEQRSKGKYVLNGHYVRERQVGRGQHGQVFKAIDIERNTTPVAIKVVKRNNPRANRMRELRRHQSTFPASDHTPLTARVSSTETKIRKEIAIMKKCRHANVVMLLEIIDDPISERIFMVMEYLGGGELKWKTRDSVPKPILRSDQIRRICRDVILGLEYLHFQGIIHRDIKPANLVWNDDRSTVKITDFGVSHFSYAQRLAAAPRSGSKMVDQTDPTLLDDSDLAKRAGTPFYLAPEVVDSDWTDSGDRKPRAPITKAIDVWAFGITLYSLLFGGPPFNEDDPQPHAEFRVYRKICTEDWDVPETMAFDVIPTGGRHPTKRKTEGYQVIKLLEALLEKDPTKRITLPKLKAHPWILKGISDPERWIRETTSKDDDAVFITEQDTTSAMAPFAHGTWGRIQRRFSNILRRVAGAGRSQWSREQLPDHSASLGTLPSEGAGPNSSVKKRHPAAAAPIRRRRDKSQIGPSGRHDEESTPRLRRRHKSIDLSPSHDQASTRSTSTVAPSHTPRKTRSESEGRLSLTAPFRPRGAAALVVGSSPSQPSPLSSPPSEAATTVMPASEPQRSYWLFAGVRKWTAGRSSLDTAQVTHATATASPSIPKATSAAVATSSTSAFESPVPEQLNKSEEALRSRGPPPSDPLTTAKRASSWGGATDFEDDDESLQSDAVTEIEMRVGAGGFADLPTAPRSQPVDGVAGTSTEPLSLSSTQRQEQFSDSNQVFTSSDDDGLCSWTDDDTDSGSEGLLGDGSSEEGVPFEDREEGTDEYAQIVMRTRPRNSDSSPSSPRSPND